MITKNYWEKQDLLIITLATLQKTPGTISLYRNSNTI